MPSCPVPLQVAHTAMPHSSQCGFVSRYQTSPRISAAGLGLAHRGNAALVGHMFPWPSYPIVTGPCSTTPPVTPALTSPRPRQTGHMQDHLGHDDPVGDVISDVSG